MSNYHSTVHPWDNWSPHQILGLEPGASCKDIRQAWMDKIWEHHPDLQPNDLKEHGREITKYANAAYSDLYADCPRASHDDGVDVSGHSHNETSLSS